MSEQEGFLEKITRSQRLLNQTEGLKSVSLQFGGLDFLDADLQTTPDQNSGTLVSNHHRFRHPSQVGCPATRQLLKRGVSSLHAGESELSLLCFAWELRNPSYSRILGLFSVAKVPFQLHIVACSPKFFFPYMAEKQNNTPYLPTDTQPTYIIAFQPRVEQATI